MGTTDSAPAGGAAIGQVIGASAAAMLATAALLYVGWAHRTGRNDWLRRISNFAARDTGLAPWAALPAVVATASLLVAVLGMYWDISLHIDNGRDPGPLANPAHYLILAGLFGIFASGFLAIVLPEGKPGKRALHIAGDWYAPLGGIAMLAASAFALIGFPLDDIWHRIFGQDVTLWGPTHLMLIGGAGLTLIGTSMLVIEGTETAAAPARRGLVAGTVGFVAKGRRVFAMGGLLIGLSTFQGEFDFGVPQFQFVLEPIMLAFAAGVALVAARIWIGRGGAIGAALFFIVVRGALALIVGGIFGESVPHFPLYLGEAVAVEVVALVVSTQRTYTFGAVAGVLVGTVGLAAEYAWSHVWMPVAWPSGLLAEAIVPVLVTAIAAGVLGAFMGASFDAAGRGERVRPPALAPAAVALAAIVAAVALNVGDVTPSGWNARVSLQNVDSGPDRTVDATVRIDPPQATDEAFWLSAISWQGGGKLVLDQLDQVSPGVWRTTEPLPVHGTWKTLIRLHRDNVLAGVPIYLPEDSAIPAKEVPAKASFERPFVDETQILQREQKGDVPGYLAAVAYAVVGTIVCLLIALLGWVLVRISREPEPERPDRSPASRRPAGPREVPA
ncbi:MAG: hypothetical protein ACJ75R_00275 [Solirubrobacterales bacterium]